MLLRRLITIAIATASVGVALCAEVDYNRDVRTILSDKCFSCHGFDESSREADLRLDDRTAALDSGAVVPGRPDESLIIERITSSDPDLVMPPPSSNKSLSDQQKATLTEWVSDGAIYDSHWAFSPVERPVVPDPGSHPIDAFVREKLASTSLDPANEADRYTLIRRVSQDLTGLLPSIDEVDRFVTDSSPSAYEDLVDRLLASPHYGERWGRHWLDQARYADSHGYTIDGARVMWPFRDWVIHAVNSDMPFDQFTIEQLAGDLLPDPTKAQLVATAFHRNTMINQEGGVKADQYRNEAIVDRVNTTGAVWLGLTIGCAQCHTHKYDPISHSEYYKLYAFFNGAEDANDSGPRVDVHEGEMFGFSDDQRFALAELAELRAERRRLTAAKNDKQNQEDSWIATSAWSWQTSTQVNGRTNDGQSLIELSDGSLLAPNQIHPNASYRFEVPAARHVSAIRLRVLPHRSLPNRGPGRAGNGNFVITSLAVSKGGQQVPVAEAWADHSQPGYPVQATIDGNSTTGWAINVDRESPNSDAKMNAPHEAVFILAKPVSGPFEIELRHDANSNYQVGRMQFEFSSQEPDLSDPNFTREVRRAEIDAEMARLTAVLPGEATPVKQMVIREVSKPPKTYRLDRGDFLSPVEDEGPLTPDVPSSLRTDTRVFEDRLDLARWLVSPENPLTARVTVNRVWQRYFGVGLVETENDFGLQGAPPSHPKLLDWLAAEFMRPTFADAKPWSMKHLHKTIVMSHTYRQSSKVDERALRLDPRNRLLARQSRFRVEAEIVRDQALVASGLFSPKIGGPSVYPPQPEGIYAFTQNKKNWPTAEGPDRFRRTLYTMFYRSAPHPLLTTFDSPDFSVTCTRRVRSNTPLQALAVANDPMFYELAEAIADRARKEKSHVDEQIRQIFRLLLSRPAGERELEILRGYYDRQRMDAAGEAALTAVARALLNTDEFLTRN